MTKLTAKSSTIFIASGDRTRVYHSLSDVPPVLRRRLEQSTRGVHSATILIADRRGREELVRALKGNARRRAPQSPNAAKVRASVVQRINLRGTLLFLVPILFGILIWMFIANRY